MPRPIYLDNHATTQVDPRVVAAMEPYWTEQFGNAGSTSHAWGTAARDAVEAARATIARAIGADPSELIFTSGATESNNLALRGLAERHAASSRRQFISVATEHRAVLDPLQRLAGRDFPVTLLPVEPRSAGAHWGRVSLTQLPTQLTADTLLVSVMLANNETGVIQPLAQIASLC
ncbi:MAG: aminotransferase class V-fold PLP-dependent enzyme, partial [Planctomycetales bacterium]|nr:aminotransferase class V-fold PLP-dependent enzyme [Planctomycetales bacterium]